MRPLVGAMGLQGTPEAQAAMEVLKKYGADAHVYIPGVGNPWGVTTGNYQLSTGTDAVTGQPVGRVDDSLGGITASQTTSGFRPTLKRVPILGPELVTNGGFDSGTGWTPGTGWAISGGVATATASSAILSSNDSYTKYNTGSSYLVTASVSGVSGGSLLMYLRGALFYNQTATNGYISTVVSAGSSTASSLNITASALTASIDNISVKEVLGYKDVWYWQFDGTDDRLSLGSVPFQMSDDHAVVVGARCDSFSAQGTIFSVSNTSATNPIISIDTLTSGTKLIRAFWRDDAATQSAVSKTSGNTEGNPFVAAARKTTNAKELRVSGVSTGVDSTALSTSTLNTSTVGVMVRTSVQYPFPGPIYAVIAIKGTVSDADLKTLEKWVGQLSNVSIL